MTCLFHVFDSREEVNGGLAVDIGTTTASAVLINMETGEILLQSSAGNGQIRFGADFRPTCIEAEKLREKDLLNAVIKEKRSSNDP